MSLDKGIRVPQYKTCLFIFDWFLMCRSMGEMYDDYDERPGSIFDRLGPPLPGKRKRAQRTNRQVRHRSPSPGVSYLSVTKYSNINKLGKLLHSSLCFTIFFCVCQIFFQRTFFDTQSFGAATGFLTEIVSNKSHKENNQLSFDC